jgi:hypothetical protein
VELRRNFARPAVTADSHPSLGHLLEPRTRRSTPSITRRATRKTECRNDQRRLTCASAGLEEGELNAHPGALTLDWRHQKDRCLLPRLDAGELRPTNPGNREPAHRIWIDRVIHVRGRPEWVDFGSKVHHSAVRTKRGQGFLLDDGLSETWERARDGIAAPPWRYRLHYVDGARAVQHS